MATATSNYYRDSTGQWWALSLGTDGSANTIQVSPQGPTLATPTFTYYIDSTGQYWEFSVNPDGSLNTTSISQPTPGPGGIAVTNNQSTITLLETMEWAKRFVSNRNFAIGNFLEPAVTSANIVLQTIIGAPFRWRWNRTITGFVTTPGQQDYYLFNWAASTQVDIGWVLVDTNGNCQSVVTPGVTVTGTSYPAWNSTVGGVTFDGTGSTAVTWQNLGSVNGFEETSHTYNFNWIETASVQDVAGKWWEMEPLICLASDSVQARPRFISGQGDNGSGNISFRVMPVPDASYPVVMTLQNNSPLFTSVNQTWGPIPDNYSNIYNWGFLSLMFLFSDDPRFQLANQKFVTSILGTNQGLDQTEINIFLNNWQAITGAPIANQQRLSQGQQARGV